MNELIAATRKLIEKCRKAVADLNELEALRGQLESEAKNILSHLSDLPAEVLVLPQSGGEHFPAATAQKLRSLNSVRTKLELLPGVKAKQQTQLGEMTLQLRAAVKALLTNYHDAALAKMEKDQTELATHLLKHYPGDADGARVAATKALQPSYGLDFSGKTLPGCNAWKWQETFGHHTHESDPLKDAEAVIGLAEAFARGEPCE
jgi:hypothetical protein